MKTDKNKKVNKKFDLEKMEIAKLKNLRSIIGGGNPGDDPVDTNRNRRGGSTTNCG